MLIEIFANCNYMHLNKKKNIFAKKKTLKFLTGIITQVAKFSILLRNKIFILDMNIKNNI